MWARVRSCGLVLALVGSCVFVCSFDVGSCVLVLVWARVGSFDVQWLCSCGPLMWARVGSCSCGLVWAREAV